MSSQVCQEVIVDPYFETQVFYLLTLFGGMSRLSICNVTSTPLMLTY